MALSDRDKRALTILGGVLGIALVGFLLMTVLGGGGGDEASTPPISGGPVTPPSPTATPKTPRETLPPVVLAGARDPFSQPPVFASPSPSGGVSPSASGTGPGTTSPSSSPTPTSPGGGASAPLGGKTVVLIDIYDGGTKAQIEVDGTVHTVREGQDFAGNLHLASINGSCAVVSSGSDSATVCLNPQK
jgi:hypothetical protein